MSCDFRLTMQGRVFDDKTHKLTEFMTPGWSALVAVTGIGVLDGQNIGRWVAAKLGELRLDSQLDDLLAVLKSAETSVRAVIGDRRLTFTVGAIAHGRSVVAMVSNFQSLNRATRLQVPDAQLTISVQRPTRVRLFAAGSGSTAVRPEDRVGLEGLAQAGAPQQQLQDKLIELNERVAATDSSVSRGCYVASLMPDGSGSSRPYLTDEQHGDFIPPQLEQILKSIPIARDVDEHGNPLPVRLVQTVSASTPMNSGYFKRELPRRPNDAGLWSNYGAFLRRGRHTKEAEAAFRKAIELDPASAPARQNLAGLLAGGSTTASKARRIYEELLSENNLPSVMRSDFANLLERTGDLDLAEVEYRMAAEAGDSARAQARYAWFVWQRRNDVERAADLFDAIPEATAGDVETLRLIAMFEWQAKGDADVAEESFAKAISADPKDAWTLRAYADFLASQRGDARSALHYYRRANKIFRNKDASLESNEGLALLGIGSPPVRALERFHRAIKLDSSLVSARANLVFGMYLADQYQLAEENLGLLLNRDDIPAGIVLELNAFGALFSRSEHDRQNRREAVERIMRSGAQLDSIALDILERKFRGLPEMTIIQNWRSPTS